jgi:hypothetical protein
MSPPEISECSESCQGHVPTKSSPPATIECQRITSVCGGVRIAELFLTTDDVVPCRDQEVQLPYALQVIRGSPPLAGHFNFHIHGMELAMSVIEMAVTMFGITGFRLLYRFEKTKRYAVRNWDRGVTDVIA